MDNLSEQIEKTNLSSSTTDESEESSANDSDSSSDGIRKLSCSLI